MGSSSAEVASVLHLDPNSVLYREIKAVAREALQGYLNLGVCWSKQDPKRIAQVRSEISKSFPGVFEGPGLDGATRQKRMKAIMTYLQRYSGMARWHYKKKSLEAKVKAVRGATLRRGTRIRGSAPSQSPSPLADDDPMVKPQKDDIHTSAAQNLDIPRPATAMENSRPPTPTHLEVVHATSSSTRPSNEILPIGMPSPSRSALATGSTSILSLADPADFPFAGHMGTISRPMTTSQSSSITLVSTPVPPVVALPQIPTLSEYRVDEVAAFLRSCQSDMQFLLNSFITFGLRSNKYLSMVAEWPDSEVDEFLRRVIGVNPEILNVLPEMELYLLRRHLKAYFSST